MAKQNDTLEFRGRVIEVLPHQMFRVELENKHVVLAYTGGKIKKNKIKVILGDAVDVEMSPYDLNKGRIVYRHK